MNISSNNSPAFGWNIKTHIAVTEKALQDNILLSKIEKRMLGRFSQMPDKDPREVVNFISPHFYDVKNEDPSFGTVNDARNNALSRFLSWTNKAKKEKNREEFLRKIGYAAHYLQDAATPPHTEHGNYLHKLFRLPLHNLFEKGKNIGASSRLDVLEKNYVYEEIPISSIKSLLHNNALFTVQPENLVKYRNYKKWPEIQQRCYDRSVNSTKAFFDYIMQYLPEK